MSKSPTIQKQINTRKLLRRKIKMEKGSFMIQVSESEKSSSISKQEIDDLLVSEEILKRSKFNSISLTSLLINEKWLN